MIVERVIQLLSFEQFRQSYRHKFKSENSSFHKSSSVSSSSDKKKKKKKKEKFQRKCSDSARKEKKEHRLHRREESSDWLKRKRLFPPFSNANRIIGIRRAFRFRFLDKSKLSRSLSTLPRWAEKEDLARVFGYESVRVLPRRFARPFHIGRTDNRAR